MTETEGLDLRKKKLPMGIVLGDLSAYQRLIHAVSADDSIAATEFTYRAPLYKANDRIKERLRGARGALDKFDTYFEEAILDEQVRIQLAQRFRADYIRKNPGSEASDLFLASGEVLGFAFDLKPPEMLQDPTDARMAIEAHPHDREVVSSWVKERRLDKGHLHGEVKLFLDHVYNPRRRDEPEVKKVMSGARAKDPVIAELYTSGAVPGYFVYALEPIIDEVDGALVWLPG